MDNKNQPKIIDNSSVMDTIKNLNLDALSLEKNAFELLQNIALYIHEIILNNKTLNTFELRKYAEKHYFEYDISMKWFSTQPHILQVLALFLSVLNHKSYKAEWLAIIIYISILLKTHSKPEDSKKLLIRFKTAAFYQTKNYTWIWSFLPDITDDITLSPDSIIKIFSDKLEQLKDENEGAIANKKLGIIESTETTDFRDKKIKQLSIINRCLNRAWYPDEKTKKPKKTSVKPRQSKKGKQSKKTKPPKLSHQDFSTLNLTNNEFMVNGHESGRPAIRTSINFLTNGADTAASIEEKVDNYESPYFGYRVLIHKNRRSHFELESLDFSMMQNHISQRDLGFNSNPRLLSEVGCKLFFNRLATDIKSNDSEVKAISSVLLLSMITACPVFTLLEKGFLTDSGLFVIGKYRSYLQSDLNITQVENYDPNKNLNEKSLIKLPLPTDLLNHVKETAYKVKKEQISNYLKILKTELGLTNLSISSIEPALHNILLRYTDGSDSHIADLICRTPSSKAPAIFYSSHSNQELVSHYRAALEKLDINNIFDLGFIDKYKENFTTGSGFALSLDYVRSFIQKLASWVFSSESENDFFNRFTTYVWYVFCILTGARPNNGLTNVMDLDLETGWFLVDDKPNRKTQSHRLIPLCNSLIELFELYKIYLSVFDAPDKHQISTDIYNIKNGNDISLLNLLSKTYDSLNAIKRGQIIELSRDFAPFSDPYWTRHFVRVQLEAQQLNMSLINTIIGHEKPRQQALGSLSSISKAQIFNARKNFEHIAKSLDFKNHTPFIHKIIEIYPYAKAYLPT